MILDPLRPLDGGAPPDGDFARYVERMVEASRLRLAAAARADVKTTMTEDLQSGHVASRPAAARDAVATAVATLEAQAARLRAGGHPGASAGGASVPGLSARSTAGHSVATSHPGTSPGPATAAPGSTQPPDLAAFAQRALGALGRAGFEGVPLVLLLGGGAWLLLGTVLGLPPFADAAPLGLFAVVAAIFMRKRRG